MTNLEFKNSPYEQLVVSVEDKVVEDEQCGYDDSMFTTDTPEYLHCVICTLVLRDPLMIISCGHKFCSPCFARIKSHAHNKNIPVLCPTDCLEVDLTEV